MQISPWKIFSAVALFIGLTSGAVAQPPAEEQAVRAVVQIYLNGLKFNNVTNLRKAFHPEATLLFRKNDGMLGIMTQERWYKGFEKTAGQEEKGVLQITALDVTGWSAAVKVREEYDKAIYTDYLSLLKIGDEWKIVNKVYVAEKK